MKRVLLTILCAALAVGQDGTNVSVSQGPPYVAYSTLLFYSSTDLIYTCSARTVQPTATFIISGVTPFALTSIGDAANTATVTTASVHGLSVNDKIVISGATIDTDLNGTYAIVTVGATTTFTITTANVADATYTEAGLKFTTTAPRDTAAIWSVKKFTYASNLVVAIQWMNGISAPSQICANRATAAFQ